MSPTLITCSECGDKNTPTQLHCKRCGAKLNLNSVRFSQGSGIGRWVGRLLHLAVFVAMLTFLGLLLWSPEPEGAVGSREDGYVAYQNMVQLMEAIASRRSLHRDFSEEEMNAYLAVRVDDSVEENGRRQWQLALESINLSFTDAGVTVHITTRWRFLALAYTLQGEPFVEGRGVQLRLERVALGRVRIPGPLLHAFAMRMMPIVEALDHDWAVLQNVTRIGVRPGACRLMVEP